MVYAFYAFSSSFFLKGMNFLLFSFFIQLTPETSSVWYVHLLWHRQNKYKKIYLSGYLLNICVCLYIISSQHMVGNEFFFIFWKIYINSWPFADSTDITWTYTRNNPEEQKYKNCFYKNSNNNNNNFCFSFNLNSFKLKTISTSKASNNNNNNNNNSSSK